MDCPTIGADLLGPNNVIRFPVSAFDQVIRLDPEDQLERCIVIERGHETDTPQSSNNTKTIFQGIDRPVWRLAQLLNRWVRVQSNQECCPEGCGFFQIGDVPSMEDIKNAVGEYQGTREIVDPLSERIPVWDDFLFAVHRSQRSETRCTQTP